MSSKIKNSIIQIELNAARRAELAADAKYTTALLDLESAAAQRMPVDALMRMVANVAECEMRVELESQKVLILETFCS